MENDLFQTTFEMVLQTYWIFRKKQNCECKRQIESNAYTNPKNISKRNHRFVHDSVVGNDVGLKRNKQCHRMKKRNGY